MLQKYPVGLQDFEKIRTKHFLYIDKTRLIHDVVKRGGYYFLSRPRRFGKSLLISTIQYLYEGRRELFEGLEIDKHWNWNKKNPVIKISFSNIGHKDKGVRQAINDELDAIAQKYNITLSSHFNSGKFKELIEKLSVQNGKVVVLIDEYDKPIIDYLGTDTAQAVENREILKAFYSILKDADPFLELVFITGVSKFSRVSIFSDLNNLFDLTLNPNFADICGITQAELEQNFVAELAIIDTDKLKKWYNGYSFGGINNVYNPFSILNFFAADNTFNNYWFGTGTPTFLVNLTKTQQLYDFEGFETDITALDAYDIENLRLLPLMFQTGYLTIKSRDEEMGIYTLDYPNLEVRQAYLNTLATNYIQDGILTGKIWANTLRKALEVGAVEKLQSLFNALFKSIPYEIWQKENEHYYHAIIHLTFRLLGIYVESQVQTSDGRMDALVQTNNYVYAFEFKLDGSAEKALQQVLDKGYLEPYLHQNKTCFAIGLNFSKTDKKVEKLLWQQI
jgi:Predicted AAA-ATPase/PD-(D/E)XK nuclease superfamily